MVMSVMQSRPPRRACAPLRRAATQMLRKALCGVNVSRKDEAIRIIAADANVAGQGDD
jgi:hypothetical protein